MLIRPAERRDVEPLAALHVRGWQIGYRGLLPGPALDALSVAHRVRSWHRIVDESDLPRRGPLLAEIDGVPAGFGCVGPGRGGEPADRGEVWSFYVDPSRWRAGIGRTLMARCLDTLRNAGYADAVLWVLHDNARAIGFYEATGWVSDGATKSDTFAGVPIQEVRLHHDLGRTLRGPVG